MNFYIEFNTCILSLLCYCTCNTLHLISFLHIFITSHIIIATDKVLVEKQEEIDKLTKEKEGEL